MMANVQEKLQQLQSIEQNMLHLLQQRQQFQMQEMELESALEELKKTETNSPYGYLLKALPLL